MSDPRNSDIASAKLAREAEGPNFQLTAQEAAEKLHEHMVGKTVVITGVSKDGLGAVAARAIAQHKPKLLILASRSESAIAEVVNDIRASVSPGGRGDMRILLLDLGSQKSVREAASKVLEMAPIVDVLINNAGVMMLPQFQTTADGIEAQFGINHIGHFLFANLIMPALLASPSGGRVVTVSSAASASSPVRFDDCNFGNGSTYEPYLAYAQSKTANLLFVLSLAQKLGNRGIGSFGVDPGAVGTTQLSRSIPLADLVARGWKLESGEWNPASPFKSAEQSVASYIIAAYDPNLKEHNGATITAGSIDTGLPAHTTDPDAAERLWSLSEKLVGQEFRY